MLFSFFHNFVKLKLVILFSRLISFFPIFNRVMKNYKKLPIDPTPTPPTLTRTRFGRGGEYVGGGGTGHNAVLGTFWKITTYWPPLDERVRSSFAENCKN